MRIDSNYISPLRAAVESPPQLVIGGKPIYGTFTSPLRDINLITTDHPCGKVVPKFMLPLRYTEWQAFEINFDQLTIVSAVYKMGGLKFCICVLFDKESGNVSTWRKFMPGNKISVAKNLLDSSVSRGDYGNYYLCITNDFEHGKCHAECTMTNNKYGTIEYVINAEDISPPSIVNIPLSTTHPLYTEKNLFKATGHVIVNGTKYCSSEASMAIVDDHKGFYPFKAGYDWLTAMTPIIHDGKEIKIGINLTRNQSVNQGDYNENVLWLEGESYALPPVTFTKTAKNLWHIADEHGLVDLNCTWLNRYKMMVHLGVIDITYSLAFTSISGSVTDSDGMSYTLDKVAGIAEYRRQRI